MNINIPTKTQRVLKKILGVQDIQPIIQDVVDTWISHTIERQYQSRKTTTEKIDEIDKGNI